MTERPFSSNSLSDVVRFLQKRGGMKAATLSPETGFTFDCLLVGEDPLTMVVVEAKESASEGALRAVARKVQTFAWSLYAQQKHNLVTLVLIIPEAPSPETMRLAFKDLNGTARLFVIPGSASRSQIELELNSLVAPAFTVARKEAVGFEQLRSLADGIDAKPILDMVSSSSTEDELKSQLIKRLESLSTEVQSALKKP